MCVWHSEEALGEKSSLLVSRVLQQLQLKEALLSPSLTFLSLFERAHSRIPLIRKCDRNSYR